MLSRKLFFIAILLSIQVHLFAQNKFPGKVIQLTGNIKMDSLMPAGYAVAKYPLQSQVKDTLANANISFRSSIGKIAISEVRLFVRDKVIIQYQVNTFDELHTKLLSSHCNRVFGETVKTMGGVKSAMYYWKHFVNGKEVHTVLITARGGRKGELISWVVNV